jgi:hypothetical protein
MLSCALILAAALIAVRSFDIHSLLVSGLSGMGFNRGVRSVRQVSFTVPCDHEGGDVFGL